MKELDFPFEKQFQEIRALIREAKLNIAKSINYRLIDLYWAIGQYISKKCSTENWGTGVVENLSSYLKDKEPDMKGFSSQNLWRMRQFYDTYNQDKKLSPLVREISWTNNMIIIAQTKNYEEREFYLRHAATESYSKKELQRQLDSGLFERTFLSKENISPVAREIYPDITNYVREYYNLDFLGLSNIYTEHSFQKAILKNLKNFILEFGKDFLFVEEEFKLQVGNKDYSIDLLFYHRTLNCLVAFELKIGEFKPEYMGKMDFYLGALDKYVKKEHENPSIGIILCKTKEESIVEISLNRSVSPTVISEYETKLINKKMLREKLNNIFESGKENNYE